MSGFITIERDVWKHPVFAKSEMTECEAWIWMVAQASWAGTRHRVGREMFDVPRGSFMVTLRELQAAFMWKSDKRVRTFLKLLEKEAMIGRTAVGARNASKTHVTICNYDEFQTKGRTKDAPKTQERTHHGRTTDAVKKQGNKVTIKDTNVSLSESPPAIDEIAIGVRRFNAVAQRVGWPQVQKVTPQRRSALKKRIEDVGGLGAWTGAIDRAALSPLLTGDNNRGWAADFDWLAKPANFTKLMEGNYDPRNTTPNGGSGPNGCGGVGSGTASAFAAVAADMQIQQSGGQ